MVTAGYVVVTLEFNKVGKRWIAHCKELGTATFGHSLTEAERRIKEAVFLHLNTLEDVGERERFFREHNIEFHRTRPTREVTVRIPLNRAVFVQPHIQSVRESTPA